MANSFLRRWRLITISLVITAMVAGLVFARGSATSAAEAPRLTSAEIMDGLLFSEGPAVKYLTSISREVEWTEDMRGFQATVKEAMAQDRYYSGKFAEQMQSGDPLQVQQALNQLGATVRRTLDRLYGTEAIDEIMRAVEIDWQSEDLLRDSVQDKELAPLNAEAGVYKEVAIAAHTVAIVLNLAIIMNVVVIWAIFILALFFNSPGKDPARTLLAREIQASRIAADLRYAR